ncbi:MAG TPA: elongation factor 1-beta [Candidatus Pacearchaeota archaeon]|nr:elongation factor 1-beta [Candidatus Pacearchaeota archaeon]
MGVAAVKIKLMPVSPETDLKKIEEKTKEILAKNNVKNPQFEVQKIAFGIKALIVLFGWPEEKSLEELEENLKKISEVNSVDVIDIRRAIG